MRQLPKIVAAIALAAGPTLGHAAETPAKTPNAASPDTASSNVEAPRNGVGVAQNLENVPGTSIPAVLAGVAGAAVFGAVALGLGSSSSSSTTGTN